MNIADIDELLFEIDQTSLQKTADLILRDFYAAEMPDFSFVITSPEEIQKLNYTYRQTDQVTDVLSFPSDGEIDPQTGREYLGDIIICYEEAKKQAKLSEHPVQNEIVLLLIHGLLHLLGYDHANDEDKEEMWRLQNEYLARANCKLGRKPGDDFDF